MSAALTYSDDISTNGSIIRKNDADPFGNDDKHDTNVHMSTAQNLWRLQTHNNRSRQKLLKPGVYEKLNFTSKIDIGCFIAFNVAFLFFNIMYYVMFF